MLALTVFSVFASEVLTGASIYAMHMEPAAMKIALILAALVPAIVAPMAAYLLTQLMFEIEQAHAQLKIVASRDSLTQVFNRHYFMDQLEMAVARSLRTGESLY